MFSGLVQEIGTLLENRRTGVVVRAKAGRWKNGDSVAVNGVCLTVIDVRAAGASEDLRFQVSEETLSKTTIGNLSAPRPVNIEAALSVTDALGGHIVQGHVDGTGSVLEVAASSDGKVIWFSAPPAVAPFLVSKGSVAVDGVSLTVAELAGSRFSAALIPYTLEHTTLNGLTTGDAVNLEADIIAKYVAKYVNRS
jgi:riboflavin synthase